MDGAGVHTFKLVNKAGRDTYVKFHWKTKQGEEQPSSMTPVLCTCVGTTASRQHMANVLMLPDDRGGK